MSRRALARWAGLAVVLAAVPVAADDGNSVERPAVVPGLVIKGTEKGEGTISVSADLLLGGAGRAGGLSGSIVPTIEVQSNDGLASVLSFGTSGAETNAAWRGGFDFTLRVEQDLGSGRTAKDYEKAVLACLGEEKLDLSFEAELRSRLADSPTAQFGTAGHVGTPISLRLRAASQSFDYGKLCEAGKKVAVKSAADDKRPLPLRQYSMGFRVGQSTMKHLKAGTVADTLVLAEEKPWTSRIGVTGIIYKPSLERVTFEWGATYSNEWKPAKEKIRWCVPKDPVDVDPADGSDPTAAAQTCDERPGAPPTEAHTLRAMFAVGMVSNEGLARGALGVFGEITGSEKKSPFKIGFTAPVYLQYANKDYSGLVRVLPSLAWTRDAEGEKGWEATLSLALLGKRNLFPSALD